MLFNSSKTKRRGSLIVEATLVLPIVIITLLFIANILNICMVHLCMQQALNNTAKKFSQYSYLAYRIAGEKNFASIIDSLNNVDDGYADFENKATLTKNAIDAAQESLNTSMEGTANLLHTFDGFSISQIDIYCEKLSNNIDAFVKNWFGENEATDNEISSETSNKGTIGEFKNVQKSFADLYDSGEKNVKSIILKLLIDTGTSIALTPIAEKIFTNYTEKMAVPASRIDEISAFQSAFNSKAGAFTMVITYKYVNPFSFINSESFEYSVINKTIRMANIITVKPFIGKNGTSLIKKSEVDVVDKNTTDDDKVKVVYVVTDDIEKVKIKYHNDPLCPSLNQSERQSQLLSYVTGKTNDYTICNICKDVPCENGQVFILKNPTKVKYHTSLECQYCKGKDNINTIDEKYVINSDLYVICDKCENNK